MNDFLNQLAECLDRSSVTEFEVIVELPEWDSLSVLSVIAMIDASYRVNLVAADLREMRTAADLWALVQARQA